MARAAKERSRACTRCGHRFRDDRSQCPSCRLWNHDGGNVKPLAVGENADQTVLLSDVKASKTTRIITGPWDPCFGGGIVRASVVLIGGAPGAGKSTLGLQLGDALAEETEGETLYIAAEEANEPISARADRLGLKNKHRIRLVPMGATSDLGDIMRTRAPSGIILDSLSGIAKDIKEEVEMAEALKDYAVLLNCPVLIIDHVNKQEEFAGLMELQHVVDATVSLYPLHDEIREMVTVKNRHGASNVIVRLQMTATGLVLAAPEEDDSDDEDEDEDDDNE